MLSTPAGPIVDEEVYPADEVLSDQDIVEGKAFAGPYTIGKYDFKNLIPVQGQPRLQGRPAAAQDRHGERQVLRRRVNLKLDIQNGDIDVAFRSLSPTDIADLQKNDKVKVVNGPGGEIRYIVFNFNTMPYGAKPRRRPEEGLAVRQAMADLIDRKAISDQVYKGTYTPLYSSSRTGLTGATESFKDLYGDGSGGPNADKAKQALATPA